MCFFLVYINSFQGISQRKQRYVGPTDESKSHRAGAAQAVRRRREGALGCRVARRPVDRVKPGPHIVEIPRHRRTRLRVRIIVDEVLLRPEEAQPPVHDAAPQICRIREPVSAQDADAEFLRRARSSGRIVIVRLVLELEVVEYGQSAGIHTAGGPTAVCSSPTTHRQGKSGASRC